MPETNSRSALPLDIVRRNPESKVGKRNVGRIILFLATLVALAICVSYQARIVSFFKSEENDLPNAPIYSSTRVWALGRLQPKGEVIDVAAPSGSSDARVKILNVAEGDFVKEGELLAVLDNESQWKAAIVVAEDQLEFSRASLKQTMLVVSTTKSQLNASLRAAVARLDSAKSKMELHEGLFRNNAVSKETLDDRRLDVRSAYESVAEAQSRLARYDMSQAKGSEFLKEAPELIDITLARLNIAVSEANLNQAIVNLEKAYVRAPKDGAILNVDIREGERIGSSRLLQLGDINNMMARVEVYESDVARVKCGQEVTIQATPLSLPLTGSVERIANLVQKQSVVDANPAANTDARVVDVWVELDSESSKLASKFVNLQVEVEFH